jgi:hypothetical protein
MIIKSLNDLSVPPALMRYRPKLLRIHAKLNPGTPFAIDLNPRPDKRSAGNSHAAFVEAGTGNGPTGHLASSRPYSIGYSKKHGCTIPSFYLAADVLRSGKRLIFLILLTMTVYTLCVLSFLFSSQNPSFANDAITSDTFNLTERELISCVDEASEDGDSKSAAPACCTSSQYLYPNNRGDSFLTSIAVFLKQLAILHFNLRSPPTHRS